MAVSALILGTSEAIHSHHRSIPPTAEEPSPSSPSATATMEVEMLGTLSNLSESEAVCEYGKTGVPAKEK